MSRAIILPLNGLRVPRKLLKPDAIAVPVVRNRTAIVFVVLHVNKLLNKPAPKLILIVLTPTTVSTTAFDPEPTFVKPLTEVASPLAKLLANNCNVGGVLLPDEVLTVIASLSGDSNPELIALT